MLSTITSRGPEAAARQVVSLSLVSYLVGHTYQLRYILYYTRCRGPKAHASRGRRIIYRGSLGIRSIAQRLIDSSYLAVTRPHPSLRQGGPSERLGTRESAY